MRRKAAKQWVRGRGCLILFVILWLAASPLCFAGKYAADFLSIGVGARALALGGAAVATTGDATGTYWNPATLFRIERRALALMYAKRFFSFETYNFVSFVYAFEPVGHWGISWIRLGIDDIPIYGELKGDSESRIANIDLQPSAEPEGYFYDAENALFVSYSKVSPKPLSLGRISVTAAWGANIKYIFTRLGSARCTGVGFDLGMILTSTVNLGQISVGIVAQDAFATRLKWNTNHEDFIPLNLKAGISYTPAKGILSHFTGVFDLNTRYGFASHAGVEYRLHNLLTLRAGLHRMGYTAGVGLTVNQFRVDYAFTGEDLANSHHVSLNAVF